MVLKRILMILCASLMFQPAFAADKGYVVKVSDDQIIIDLTKKDGIDVGSAVEIYNESGGDLKHPVSGASLGQQKKRLAIGEVVDIQDKYAIVTTENRKARQAIKAGDRVVVIKSARASQPSAPRAPGIPGKPLAPAIKTGKWLDIELAGIVVADFDGNGSNEVAMINGNNLSVRKWANGSMEEVWSADGAQLASYIHIDCADINGNGRPEIFVTNLENEKLKSFVVEFTDGEFKRLGAIIPYYMRVLDLASGPRLIGQEVGFNKPYQGDVFSFDYDGAYQRGAAYDQPGNFDIYDLNPIPNGNKAGYVAINDNNTMMIVNHQGETEFQTESYYGGSSIFLEEGDDNDERNIRGVGDDNLIKHPIPLRLFIADYNNDGQKEALVVENESRTRIWTRYASYKNSFVHFVALSGVSLNRIWSSGALEGTIADLDYADIDGDQIDDIVLAFIQPASLFKKAKSTIVVLKSPM